MGTALPGSEGKAQIGFGVAKAVLRLVGGSDLADAISDLTGLGRIQVQDLARQSAQSLGHVYTQEFREVSQGDIEWAEGAVTRMFQTLASAPNKRIAKESLVGAKALTSLAFSVGLSEEDRTTLISGSIDAQAYFRALSSGVAHLIAAWYCSDPKAIQVALAVGVGELLANVRESISRIEALPAQLASSQRDLPEPDGVVQRLMSRSDTVLNLAPSYYPVEFTVARLSEGLRVAELDARDFARFGGSGLYWGGSIYSDRVVLEEQVRAGEIIVVLGDPGSGKSTLAKGLILKEISAESPALYCRLEDLSLGVSDACDDPLYHVLRACSHAIQQPLAPDELMAVVAWWRDIKATPLIVMDGLDEVATATQLEMARRCAVRLAQAGHPVVLTSRVAGYTAPWTEATRHFAVAPLSAAEQENFAREWFAASGHGTAGERFRAATGDRSLADVLSNPLTLGFVCLLAHYQRVPPTGDELAGRRTPRNVRRTG